MGKQRVRFPLLSGLILCVMPIGWVQANDTVDDEQVTVPAGEFIMGCDAGKDPVCSAAPDENKHIVYLDEFLIDKYEVTFRRYQQCVDAGRCSPPAVGGALNYGWDGVERFPVNGVTWQQAKTFCEFENRRLPTEAEWEKAARGTESNIFPWGDSAPSCEVAVVDRANAGALGCGTGNTLNVGAKPKGASPYGAMDMAGNLWEWTADWYDADYYDNSPSENPKGPATGLFKVTRGGDFFTRSGYEVRSTSRFPYEPSDYSIAIGFRCAADIGK
ncbi:MAG: formylglycine-generating enzyme family protein [Psychrobium sp.]